MRHRLSGLSTYGLNGHHWCFLWGMAPSFTYYAILQIAH